MFKTSIKVKFQDQQLDDYLLENSVLKSKLQSKIDALSIMNKELDKCSMERDRYKILVEQLKCKESVSLKRHDSTMGIYKFTPTNTISGGDMLARTRDENNMLKLEVEMLRNKLEEASGDIAALRKQLQKHECIDNFNDNKKSSSTFTCSNKDYEQLVQDLEKIKKKYQEIQLNYRTTLDEKEELVSDRDYYKNKVQRLNHQISYILMNRGQMPQLDTNEDLPKPVIDIDALITENKYLHERIMQLQLEKEILKQNLNKYKSLLHNKNKNYSLQLKKGFNDVMTQKQVREFLDNHTKSSAKGSATEMKSLCLGLFEALNDKSIALQHQRKTNQILANRIMELEKTLDSWGNGQKHIQLFPSQILHEFILDSGSVKSEDLKDKSSNELQDIADNKCKYSDSDDDNKDNSTDTSDPEISYGNQVDREHQTMGKTILPVELQDLVKEALAELKPTQ